MLSIKNGFKFVSISFFIASLVLSGCSSMPWSDDKGNDEDLFFEEDFGSEFENVPSADKGKDKEDNFFKDDKQVAQAKPVEKPPAETVPSAPDEEDFFFEDDPKPEPAPRPAPQPMSQPAKGIEQGSVGSERSVGKAL